MPSMLIRNIDEDLKRRLRVRAAENGRSMEEEARLILRSELEEPKHSQRRNLAAIAREIFGEGGVEIDIPPRMWVREPPDFSE
jgi:antitoxin FitA